MNITAFGTLEIQADGIIAGIRGVFLTAGYTHGARIANDVLGLISDNSAPAGGRHEPKGHREA